jgi:ABC-type multidrug transport system ATPase subunit
MSEKILQALMQLFAIVANAERLTAQSRHIVEMFLRQQLNREWTERYLAVFDEFLRVQRGTGSLDKVRKRASVNSVKVLRICTDINQELNQRQKYVVLIRLIEFLHSSDEAVTEQEWEFLTTVAGIFNIPDADFKDCLALASRSLTMPEGDSFLVIDSKKEALSEGKVRHLLNESLDGTMIVLFIRSVGIAFIRYTGETPLTMNSQAVNNDFIQVFTQGSVIRGPRLEPVYYSEVIHRFLHSELSSKITFSVQQAEFKFRSGNIGLHPITFSSTSGELVAIMGGSGAGKSTLLNVLNGNYMPSSGEVLINGISLHGNPKKIEGLLGYIPQDDLLIEDLTVFENLFYNTKLCFGSLDDAGITAKVTSLLEDLGLFEIRDLKVGNPLNQTISGGQRKRLNIALELVRESSILFVDEPTSGLSSRDSENVMDLLKQLSINGKLIFVVIHQPSSDIFKLFDKLLLLDTGGYHIYYGNPSDSLIYFKHLVHHVNADESECITCGNINPEQLFTIIESRVVDEYGNPVNARKVTPSEWNRLYKEKQAGPPVSRPNPEPVASGLHKPSWLRQFRVFITRDVLSKLSNRQYLLINLLEAPALALILSYLIRYYQPGKAYIFRENQNIPAFIFISVVVALFIGLSVSAEEIFRDRKILKRESFLNLSRSSYLFSKVCVMLLLSAVQMLMFVLIGNSVLGIQGMYTEYWLALFTTACFANLLGLNISSTFNSAVTIYILIPILIIPQILLSGIIVKFEKLNPTVSTHSTVPVFGELMTSRWAFEALAVYQFKENRYERYFFDDDRHMSQATFKKDFLIPELIKRTDYAILAMTQDAKKYMLDSNLRLLTNELAREAKDNPKLAFARAGQLRAATFNTALGLELKDYLNALKKHYIDQYNRAGSHKEEIISRLQQDASEPDALLRMKLQYENESLGDLLKNATEQKQIEESDYTLIQRFQPVFMEGAKGTFVRAPFFASRKWAFGDYRETYVVNIAVIWAMTGFLALALYFDVLKKLLGLGESFSRRKKKS